MASNRGFSILELLLTVAGFLGLSAVLLAVLLTTTRSIQTLLNQGMVTGQLQSITEILGRDIHMAKNRYTTALCGAVNPADLDVLILELPDAGGDGSNTLNFVIYYVDDATSSLRRILVDNCPTPDPTKTVGPRVLTKGTTQVTNLIFAEGTISPPARRAIQTTLRLTQGAGTNRIDSRVILLYIIGG